jgi:hypothetical protein
MFWLFFDILLRSTGLDAAILLLAYETTYCSSTQNYEISIFQEIHFSRLELQRFSLDLLFPFLVFILELGIRFD